MKHTRKKNVRHNPADVTESVAKLASGMADDFNNILTTVLGACSLLDGNKTADDELLKYIALIRSSAERAATLSNKLVRACAEESAIFSPAVNINSSTARDKIINGDKVYSNDLPEGASS